LILGDRRGASILSFSACSASLRENTLSYLSAEPASPTFVLKDAYAGRINIVDFRYTRSSTSVVQSTMPKRKLSPLPYAAFQILPAIAGQDLHGYGIMDQAEEQTDGKMRLGPGTLYSSIQTWL